MNRVMLIGNLAQDPKVGTTQSGIMWCNFTIAVNDGRGENRTASFFDISCWRGLADTCAKYLVKGRKVAVDGRLKKDRYTDDAGQARYRIYILAENVEFLGGQRHDDEYIPTDDDIPEQFLEG